jgi:para-nitrobenzyl esterase
MKNKNLTSLSITTIALLLLTACGTQTPAETIAPTQPNITTPDNTVTVLPETTATPEPTDTLETENPAANPNETTTPETPSQTNPTVSPSGISIQKDITYTTTANTINGPTSLTLDLYSPTDENGNPLIKNQPAVILIHGGAFIAGSKNLPQMGTIATALAENGYVVANINYRLLLSQPTPKNKNLINYLNNADPTAALPTQAPAEAIPTLRIALASAIEDANTALTWLTQQGVNPNQIAIAGESAGAITALHLAYLNDTLKLNPVTPKAIINIYGAMSKPENNGTEISKGEPALWTIHGTADQVVPYTAAEYLDTETRKSNIPHTLHTIKNAGHGITQIGYLTNKTEDGITYLQDSINFLNTHLKK